MDVVIFVRDLDIGIPPFEIDQDLDATYDRLYCGKTTLQDNDIRMNQYLEVFFNHDLVPKLEQNERRTCKTCLHATHVSL